MQPTTKQEQLKKLIEDMRKDSSMKEIWVTRKGKKKNVGLVNQFQLHNHIPNKWFDWVCASSAEIMIIGQDWGPYAVLKEFISPFDMSKQVDKEYYRDFLFKGFSSRTEKFILKAVEKTYEEYSGKKFTREHWDKIFFTMAVLFTRQGKLFRGNELFDLKKSCKHSYSYVSRQIDIVKPKLIIPLGNMAFDVVNRHFNLGYKDPKITKVISGLGMDSVIHANETVILPNFHPAAHVDPKVQLEIWRKMWNFVEV